MPASSLGTDGITRFASIPSSVPRMSFTFGDATLRTLALMMPGRRPAASVRKAIVAKVSTFQIVPRAGTTVIAMTLRPPKSVRIFVSARTYG